MAQIHAAAWNDVAVLQKSKKIRPEDVDLPDMDVGYSYETPEGQLLLSGTDPNAQRPVNPEEEKNAKRKKLLAAQLKSIKKIEEIKEIQKDKPKDLLKVVRLDL